MKAKDITGEAFHHTVGDVDTLQELVRMLPPNPVIVNIGACFGTSTLAMLEARPDAFIFSIDINICPKEPEHITMAGLDGRGWMQVVSLECWDHHKMRVFTGPIPWIWSLSMGHMAIQK